MASLPTPRLEKYGWCRDDDGTFIWCGLIEGTAAHFVVLLVAIVPSGLVEFDRLVS